MEALIRMAAGQLCSRWRPLQLKRRVEDEEEEERRGTKTTEATDDDLKR